MLDGESKKKQNDQDQQRKRDAKDHEKTEEEKNDGSTSHRQANPHIKFKSTVIKNTDTINSINKDLVPTRIRSLFSNMKEKENASV